MIVLVYFIVGFVIFFIMWKKNEQEIKDVGQDDFENLVLSWVFWKCILTSFLWIFAIPSVLFWNLLEIIYKQFNKSKS